MKTRIRLALSLGAWLLIGGCGEPDMRSFSVENAIFESVYLDRAVLDSNKDSEEGRARIGGGLSAICKGDTSGARQLILDSGIGNQIYKLVLVAAKANRKGSCDYSDWPQKQTLLGDRFKQLVNSGDPSAVLLAAFIDKSLAQPDRLEVVKALSDRRYSHAEAIYAGMLIGGDSAAAQYPKALELLEDAAKQGATPGYMLLARMHKEGLGTPKDIGKACKYLRDAESHGVEGAKQELNGLREGNTCQ
jgi:hypothetical protein